MSIRIGDRIIGKVKISFGKSRQKLHLGERKYLNLEMKRFARHETLCFRCQTCQKWRKRLFLFETTSDIALELTYKLQCRECAPANFDN